jgi:hypothetical protein
MDHQDVEFRGCPSSSAMESAPFRDVPRNGASLGRERDLLHASISSSWSLPIREVSESAMQRAQARDTAETSTSTSRNFPIREVSESAVQKTQDHDPLLNVDTPVGEMARTFPLHKTFEAAAQDHSVAARVQRYADEACKTPFVYDSYNPRELHDLMTSWVDKLMPEEKERFDNR